VTPRDAKHAFAAIRAVLWRDWDPIGCGVPEDEYDSYIPDVMNLLRERATPAAIEAYLRETAAEAMSSPISPERAALVRDKLLALNLNL